MQGRPLRATTLLNMLEAAEGVIEQTLHASGDATQ